MKRREQRETIFKLLFISQFNSPEDMPFQVKTYLDSLETGRDELSYSALPTEEEQTYMSKKYEDVVAKIDVIDEMLNKASSGWKTNRMNKVDLTILRLAVYEICFDADVPTGVAINEAVEIAKVFGGDDSASFINGVLGKIAKETNQGA